MSNYNPALEESLKRQTFLEEYAQENLAFSYISGSRLYGTNIEGSDVDIRGVFYQTAENLFSILKEDNITEVVFKGEEDKVFYELKNFGHMLREQNPSIIEAIWVEPEFILNDSDLYKDLRDNKLEFRATIALDKALGFATSQYKSALRFDKKHFTKEMNEPLRENFIKLISNPLNKNFGKVGFPIEKTCAFKHPEHPNLFTLYSSEHLDNKDHNWIMDNNFLFIKNNSLKDKEILAIVEFRYEEFKQAKLTYNNFLDWKEKGNMQKLDIASELGFQPKPMMHAIRNMLLAKEFIETGLIIPQRKEAEMLKHIREGKYSLAECLEIYKSTEEFIKKERANFSLPEFNSSLLNEIIKDHYIKNYINPVSKPKQKKM